MLKDVSNGYSCILVENAVEQAVNIYSYCWYVSYDMITDGVIDSENRYTSGDVRKGTGTRRCLPAGN